MWVILILVAAVNSQLLDPIVETKQGLIRGLRADDGEYSMYLGIPFAKVDERNPFGLASPHPKFDDIFEANDDSAICPQVSEFTHQIVGNLDCLHLHVYVPDKASPKNKLPVLVWVYGGGFSIGFGGRFLYGPKFIVRHDVILVSINYRVGPYGFLCLDTPEVPGNQGLKDQLLAFRWIKDNIAAFGGDEDKITLMGESVGGMSVDMHLLFQQETLFHQIIMQSGSALMSMIGESDKNVPLILAKKLGFDTDNDTEALLFLSQTDSNSVIAATSSAGVAMKICIEKEFENVERFITKHPLNVDMSIVKDTPIIAGFNNKEMLMVYAHRKPDEFKGFEMFRSALGRYFIYDEEFVEMEDIVRRFYIGDEEMSEALRWDLMDFASDITFSFPVQWSIDNYLENGASKIYQYLFSYSGGRNFVKKRMNITEDGAAHADEIGYLFDLSYEVDAPSKEDQRMIDQITTLWTNFVKYGEPIPETTDLIPIKWIPVTKETNNFLNLDSELTLGRLPFNKRLIFWKLFFKYNTHRLHLYE